MNVLKVKVFNGGYNRLPAESTPFSAAKDIRAHLTFINPNLIFNGEIVFVKKETVTGFYNITVESKSSPNSEYCKTAIILKPNGRALIPSGLFMEIPEGYSMDVRPRSGLALKYGIELVNSPGLIDPDYRGDVGIIVKNGGLDDIIIVHAERIGQVKISKDVPFEWDIVDSIEDLSDTVRGEGGFNSTGTK